MMSDITPLFSSCYSGAGSSLLTLEEPGKAKPGNALSIFDLSTEAGLKEVIVCEDKIDGFIQAYKVASKLGVKLCFGLKMVVCADMNQKDDASLSTESKIIVFAREGSPNSQGIPKGYSDLIRICSRAATEGFYYQSRIDWKTLKEYWTENLLLALPFFSSFIARNTMTFNSVVPDLPVAHPWVFKEVNSGLPFAFLIDKAVDLYAKEAKVPAHQLMKTKSIYYRARADLKPLVVMKAQHARTTFVKPNINHCGSAEFSLESYKDILLS